MKHTIRLILVIALITGCILSCNKEQTSINTSYDDNAKIKEDIKLEKKILDFRMKIDLLRENPELKSVTDPMDIDSALWYIEATSNLTYGDASIEYTGDYVIDSSTIEVPVTSGQILWTHIQLAYDQTIDSLSAHYNDILANQKQLMVADISLKESYSSKVILLIISGFGTDGNSGPGSGWEYPWYWGWDLGRCDGTGLGSGYDAADIIAQFANSTLTVPSGNSYYTDVEWRSSTGCQHASQPEDCLFEDYQEYTLVHECLSTTDIAAYKNNLISLGDQLNPSSNHSVLKYFLEDWTAFGSYYWAMAHHADIKYGIWHTSSDPPNDL